MATLNMNKNEMLEYIFMVLLGIDNGRVITTFYRPIPNSRFISFALIILNINNLGIILRGGPQCLIKYN